MTLAQSVFPANSFEIAEVWLARGFDQWKSGSPDEGERSMSEALRMLRNRTDVPPQLLTISQLDALSWYAACLNANHHKAEARQIKSEILRHTMARNAESLVATQCGHWIDAGGAARRDCAGNSCYQAEQQCACQQYDGVVRIAVGPLRDNFVQAQRKRETA